MNLDRGVTLTHILIVVAIIGGISVVGGLGYMAYQNWFGETKLAAKYYTSKQDCKGAGYYWYNEACHSAKQEGGAQAEEPKADEEEKTAEKDKYDFRVTWKDWKEGELKFEAKDLRVYIQSPKKIAAKKKTLEMKSFNQRGGDTVEFNLPNFSLPTHGFREIGFYEYQTAQEKKEQDMSPDSKRLLPFKILLVDRKLAEESLNKESFETIEPYLWPSNSVRIVDKRSISASILFSMLYFEAMDREMVGFSQNASEEDTKTVIELWSSALSSKAFDEYHRQLEKKCYKRNMSSSECYDAQFAVEQIVKEVFKDKK